MVEQGPTEYQFKHNRRISLDNYRGVGNGIMQLSDPIADGFMKTSDMRYNVEVVSQPEQRVQDYEDVGFVRIAKFLKLPRLDPWKRNQLVQTKKDEDTWYIAVNDQELAREVSDANDGSKKFDDLFVERFKKEVRKGLASCLAKEKLLNGGNYRLQFAISYYTLLTKDALYIPVLAASLYSSGQNPLEITAISMGVSAAFHLTSNGVNLIFAGMTELGKQQGFVRPNTSGYQEPFVKHSIPELLLPTVPIDRIIRGKMYLNKNGSKMIESSNDNERSKLNF